MRLVYIALGWTAGIVLAANSAARMPLIWLVLMGGALVCLWLAWRSPLRMTLIALVAFTFGGLRFSLTATSSDVARFNDLGGLTIEGVVSAEPARQADRLQLRVDVDTVIRAGQRESISGAVLVDSPATVSPRYGDRIAATGLLLTPGEYDTFSYADFLARTDVYSTMSNAAVVVLSSQQGSPIFAALLDFKTHAVELIAHNLPEPQAGLLAGILFGEDSMIAPEVRAAFNRVGAAHVVAISGFNMVILSGVVAGTLQRLKLSPRRAAFLGIVVIAVYTILVGASASVIRAALMSSLLVIAPLLRRQTYIPASLALVALLLSAINPTALWDVGFQLSFFATLGMALFSEPLSKLFRRGLAKLLPRDTVEGIARLLYEPLIVSLAVQITTLPLIALYFRQFQIAVLLVNLLIVPAQAMLMILGVIALALSWLVPALGQALFWFDMLPLSWTIEIVRWFARLPLVDTEVYIQPMLVAGFFAAVIGGAMLRATQPDWARVLARWLMRRAVVSAGVFAGAGTMILLVALMMSRPDGQLHVWLLDVGHSNAVLAQTPGGAHLLVDGGRYPARLLTAIGDRLPFNKRTLDIVVVTQPDENQIGALPTVLSRYDVGIALMHGQDNLSPAYSVLLDSLAGREIIQVTAGYTLDMDDGTRVEVLHPQAQPTVDDPLDDNALVLRLSYGEVSFLLTSDLSADGQVGLVDAGQHPLATVLQLPQHGTRRSLDEGFLRMVQPQVVMLQSDPTNRRGDPDPDTLALLGDTPLFRTDEQGTLHLWTDGHDLWVE